MSLIDQIGWKKRLILRGVSGFVFFFTFFLSLPLLDGLVAYDEKPNPTPKYTYANATPAPALADNNVVLGMSDEGYYEEVPLQSTEGEDLEPLDPEVSGYYYYNKRKFRYMKRNTSSTATPTSSPVSSATNAPTVSPTPAPTNSPTPLVTTSLTPIPTPSAIPTAKPTAQPTRSPIPSPSPIPTPQVPSSTGVRFGVVANDYMNTRGEIPALETQIDRQISTVSIFKQFGLSGNKDFVLSDMNYLKSRGIKIQLAWEPWNPEEGMSQSVDYITAITQGKYDSYLSTFANNIKTYGGAVTIRFGHEMNGDWYPWGQRPSEYVAAYKYVYDYFKKQGVSNVTWMWCPNVIINNENLSSYYPGDNYVDVIGIDGFNFGTSQSYGTWLSFTQVFGNTYDFLTKTYSKPIIIAETGSTEMGGNKANWISSMFKTELPQRFPKVEEIIWFNLLKETDWRINSSTSTLQAFIDGL